MNLSRSFAAAAAVCLLAACSTSESQPASCATGQAACGSVCVTLATDTSNCGACGSACPSVNGGQAVCAAGQCVAICGAQQTVCQVGGADAGTKSFLCSDIANDRANCGGCGNACGGTEVCSDGRCAPCPIDQCNNTCTDTQRDPANCGTCGTACSASAPACINGACGKSISITVMPPNDTGLLPADGGTITVDVASEYRLASFTADGGPAFNLQVGGPSGLLSVNPTVWSVTFPGDSFTSGIWDGGVTFVATDEDYRADAGDAAAHQAALTVFLTAAPSITGVAAAPVFNPTVGSGQVDAGFYVPLDAKNFSLTASFPTAPPGASAVQFTSSLTGVLGTAPIQGGKATLPIDQTLVGLGQPTIQACPVNSVGQVADSSACSNSVQITVGALPGVMALESHETDGGHSLWYAQTDGDLGGASEVYLFNTPADQVVGALPENPVSDAGYIGSENAFAYADTPNSIFAIRTDATGIDRYDCAGGCRTSDYLTADAGITPAAILSVQSHAVAVEGAAGKVFVAPVTHGGPLVPVDKGTFNQFVATPTPVGNGGLLVPVQTANDSNVYDVYFYIESLGAPVQIGGDASQPPVITAWPSGDFAVQYLTSADSGTPAMLVTGRFDGTKVSQTQPMPIVSVQNPPDFQPAQPGVMVGTVPVNPQASGGASQVFIGNVSTANLTTIAFPLPVNCIKGSTTCTGGIVANGVRSRLGVPPPFDSTTSGIQPIEGAWQAADFSISDDQLKMIFVTSDLAASNSLYTLWMVDLGTGAVNSLYSSNLLVGEVNLTTPTSVGSLSAHPLAPHFVHSAPGAVSAVPGRAQTAISSTPVVVWSELLEPAINTGCCGGLTELAKGAPGAKAVPDLAGNYQIAYARIFYARYAADATPPAPVLVDKLAWFHVGRPDFYVTSAAANGIFFPGISANGTEMDILYAPFSAGSSTSSLVLDQFNSYLVREDTGFILLQRQDGVLYAGTLSQGAQIRAGLKPVLSGMVGGIPDLAANNYIPQFNFLPNGHGAWAIEQYGLNQWEPPTSGILEVVNIDTGARTNFGPVLFNPSGGVPAAGALGAGEAAFGIDTPTMEDLGNGSNDVSFGWAAAASAGTRHSEYGNNNNSLTWFIIHSLDGSEGFIVQGNNEDIVTSATSQSSSLGINYLVTTNPATYGGQLMVPTSSLSNFGQGPQSTYSPYGMPYTPAWDFLGGTINSPPPPVNGLGPQAVTVKPSVVFKNFGGAANLAPIPITPGGIESGIGTRQSSDNTELLIWFNDGSSWYARRLPLNGLSIPQQPLP